MNQILQSELQVIKVFIGHIIERQLELLYDQKKYLDQVRSKAMVATKAPSDRGYLDPQPRQ